MADYTPIVSIDNELGVRDNWTIKIFDSDIWDERLLILFAAFQTATGR